MDAARRTLIALSFALLTPLWASAGATSQPASPGGLGRVGDAPLDSSLAQVRVPPAQLDRVNAILRDAHDQLERSRRDTAAQIAAITRPHPTTRGSHDRDTQTIRAITDAAESTRQTVRDETIRKLIDLLPADQVRVLNDALDGVIVLPAPPNLGYSGDWQLDSAVRRAGVTAAQVTPVNAILAAARKRSNLLTSESASQTLALREQRMKASARGDVDETVAASEKLGLASARLAERQDAIRTETMGELQRLLDAAQFRRFVRTLERQSPQEDSPAAQTHRQVEAFLVAFRSLVTLTPEQADQVRAAVGPVLADAVAQGQKSSARVSALRSVLAHEQNPDTRKMIERQIAAMKGDPSAGYRAALAEAAKVLTTEQRAELAKSRRQRVDQLARSVIAPATQPTGGLGLSADQRKRVAALADAAREAILSLDEYDAAAREELGRQLRRDIAELLTAEQRTRYPLLR